MFHLHALLAERARGGEGERPRGRVRVCQRRKRDCEGARWGEGDREGGCVRGGRENARGREGETVTKKEGVSEGVYQRRRGERKSVSKFSLIPTFLRDEYKIFVT